MSKMFKRIGVMGLSAAMLFSTLAQSAEMQAAKAQETTVQSLIYGKEKHSFSYDITGDGKADKITAEGKDADDYSYYRYVVKVNGDQALDMKVEYGFYGLRMGGIDLDGHKLLYIDATGDNDDGQREIFSFSNGKLKKLFNLDEYVGYDLGMHYYLSEPRHGEGSGITVKGKKLILNCNACTQGIGGTDFTIQLKYKNGKLKAVSKTHVVNGYTKSLTRKKVKLLCPLKGYKNKKLTGKATTLKKGQKVKVDRLYLDGKKSAFRMIYNGKKYWVKATSKHRIGGWIKGGTFYG